MIPRRHRRPGRARAGRRSIGLLFALLLAVPLALSAMPDRLAFEARQPLFAPQTLDLTIHLRGLLAETPLTLTVTVDGRVVEKFDARGPRVVHRLRAAELVPGSHLVALGSGSEWSELEVQVRSRFWIWVFAAGLLLLLSLLLVRARVVRGAKA